MAWEPLICMTRKLLITLAGAMLRDAYLQIMIALLILIASLTLQALVQPYESRMLNTLDVLSIMVLIITQVLSILYLYLENLTGVLPLGMTSNGIEIAMTLLLFAANASVIAGLFIAWDRLRYLKRAIDFAPPCIVRHVGAHSFGATLLEDLGQ